MSLKKKRLFAILAVLIYLCLCAIVFVYVGKPFISMMNEPGKFREWTANRGIFGPVIFFVMFVLQIFFAIIPGEPFEIAAGYTFGAIVGTLLCAASVIVGQLIIFILVRKFGTRALELFISHKKINSFKFINNSEFSLKLIFLLYLIPGIPKDIISYGAGLSNISLTSYIIVSTVARLPSIATSTFGGAAIGDGKYYTAAIIFAVTAVISLASFIIHMKKQQKT